MWFEVWGMGYGALKRSDYVTLREGRSAKWYMKNGPCKMALEVNTAIPQQQSAP